MTSPVPVPEPEPALWSRFTMDPRRHPTYRASDADRDVATEVVNAAFADGRLDVVEHGERLQALLQAKTLGEIVPLLSDIVLPARTAPVARRGRLRRGTLSSWLALAVLFNVIWLATWLFSGSGPYYYWPIWPMIGTAVPAILALIASAQGPDADDHREIGDG